MGNVHNSLVQFEFDNSSPRELEKNVLGMFCNNEYFESEGH